jgi:tRNA threonylcarbamoyladenosine biosynthesis protein TsaB
LRQLVIDTATEALSVALFEDGACIAQSHEIMGRGHAEHLLPRIAALPDGGCADRIAVNTGPGSFTGLRVGLAAARALGFAWSVPVDGYGALPLVAHIAQADHDTSGGPITVVMTGGHGELFWQCFDGETLTPLTQMQSTAITNLAHQIEQTTVYGTGARALTEARGHGAAVTIHPDASRHPLLQARFIQPHASPVYGRGADAKPLQPV